MEKTDPFCKCISKYLSNGKAPQHETDLFTHIRGLLYKHVTDSGQRFLALIIPKCWKYTVLVEDHNKLGHQGNTDILFNKMTILLEGYEQRYLKVHYKLHPLPQRESQDSELPTSNDRNPQQTTW